MLFSFEPFESLKVRLERFAMRGPTLRVRDSYTARSLTISGRRGDLMTSPLLFIYR